MSGTSCAGDMFTSSVWISSLEELRIEGQFGLPAHALKSCQGILRCAKTRLAPPPCPSLMQSRVVYLRLVNFTLGQTDAKGAN